MTQDVMQHITRIPGVVADPTPFGAWLWVPDDVDQRIEQEGERIPECVIDIWRHARELGCDYVHLDRDANGAEALPTYEWSAPAA